MTSITFSAMIYLFSSRLDPLRRAGHQVRLAVDPQELTIPEVILVLLIFVGRQVLHLLGLGNQFVIKSIRSNDEESYEVPELTLTMPFRLSEADLSLYAAALDLSSSGRQRTAKLLHNSDFLLDTPAQKCVFLSAFSEPAMLLLLSHHLSPIRPLGAVNVRNRFEVLQPDLCSAEELMRGKHDVIARLKRQTRQINRGLEIDIVIEIVSYRDGLAVVIYRQVFTMLQFMRFKTAPVGKKQYPAMLGYEELIARGKRRIFTMSASTPRSWVKICKDYNPIHMSKLTAKMFGFRSTIAHGNHALAIALQQLERNQDFSFDHENRPFTMEVQFRKPIILPARLEGLVVQDLPSKCDFYVLQAEKICVVVSLFQGVTGG